MAWWNSFSAAEHLFVVCVDRPFSGSESTYREAIRRLSAGNYSNGEYCGRNMFVTYCSSSNVISPCPVPSWPQTVPKDLWSRWINSSYYAMDAAVQQDGVRIWVPAPLRPRPSGILAMDNAEQQKLFALWAPLFPGDAIVDGVTFRQEGRYLSGLRHAHPEIFREKALLRCRELTAHVQIPNQLSEWRALAAEDEGDCLAAAQDRFGISAINWQELQDMGEFRRRISNTSEALVVFGWVGVMMLQLHALSANRTCNFEGCSASVAGRQQFCDEHRVQRRTEMARERQRRSRGRQSR